MSLTKLLQRLKEINLHRILFCTLIWTNYSNTVPRQFRASIKNASKFHSVVIWNGNQNNKTIKTPLYIKNVKDARDIENNSPGLCIVGTEVALQGGNIIDAFHASDRAFRSSSIPERIRRSLLQHRLQILNGGW